ncbi:MAG TPA: penicillin-binding transpeptidase domain-containing protein [Planctomycetota bacterium]|jgi:penicillin-binding protein 2|nr:penicillin-binding transpeptidase domain-containing protein [Planctomycetota bacterium]
MERSRVMVLLVSILLPIGGLEARLVHLQLLTTTETTYDLANRRQSIEIQRPARGTILDCLGREIAKDVPCFDCYLVLEEYEKNPGALAAVLKMSPEEFQQAVEGIYEKIERQLQSRPQNERSRLYRRERRTPYLLKKDIKDAALTIEVSPQRYPGAIVRESLMRVYPYKQVGCHLLGYLGRVTANEAKFRELLQNSYFFEGFEELIGQDGVAQLYRRGAFNEEMIGVQALEKKYDEHLRGRSGLVILEREAGTSSSRTIEIKPSEPGKSLELTIDIEVQRAVEQILAGPLHAAAVVLDPNDGSVVALASNRAYDPNDFTPPGSVAAVRSALQDNENKPLLSRAFQDHFAAGSFFKVVTSVAGLEAKVVRAEEVLPCRGKFDERKTHFNCWIWNEFRGMHNEVTLHQALEKSCNCYYYEVGRRVGIESISHWGRAMGFGSSTGLDLPGEASGRIPDNGREEDAMMLAIGQSHLMVTPLQAAVMMASIANGGNRVTPHLRRSNDKPPVPLGISAETLKEIRKGLYDVTHASGGTAHNTRLKEFKAIGKTSSAQAEKGKEPHAWFVGYAPYDAPKYVVAVFMKNAGHGGQMAAPPAAQILEVLMNPKEPRK